MSYKWPNINSNFVLKQDSESDPVASTDTKVPLSDDENDQQINGINNIEATITTVNNTHINNGDSEIFQYFNGHKTNCHHAVNGVTATE